jgi:hypothetical protein
VDSRLATVVLRRLDDLDPGDVIGYVCANLIHLTDEAAAAMAHPTSCTCGVCRPLRRARAIIAAHNAYLAMAVAGENPQPPPPRRTA